MDSVFENKERCSGCGACREVCAHGAITMRSDGMGFLYPEIDAARCVGCGACVRVCPFKGEEIDHDDHFRQSIYAVKHRNYKEIDRSQSGGAFVALSDRVIARGGAVYGVGYGNGLYVMHRRGVTAEERDGFRGSKYVQSDMGEAYRMIAEDLQAGRTVMFTGTPCQTAGVRRIFGKRHDGQLLLVDLVCHGVASPGLWKDYLGWLQKQYGSQPVDAKFRDKRFGWHSHRETYTFADGKTISPDFLVYRPLFMRPSCGGCKYSSMTRCSDITIGDFWGVERVFPDFETENKGCSLVICNTSAGKRLFDDIKEEVEWREVCNPEDALQPNLREGTTLPSGHKEFAEYYVRHGFLRAMRRYCFMGWRKTLKDIGHRGKRKLKGIIKKLWGVRRTC